MEGEGNKLHEARDETLGRAEHASTTKIGDKFTYKTLISSIGVLRIKEKHYD
jgi:hypothetical protein